MVNKVILIGHLGRDAEIRRLEDGKAVAKIAVATNESYKDKNGEWQTLTEWHDVILWRNMAEYAEKHFLKGKLVYIDGKLTHRKYQDKDDNTRYITEVVASNAKLLDKKESNFENNFPTEETGYTKTTPVEATAENSGSNAAEDDLPF